MNIDQIAADYERDGYVSAVPILTEADAARHRAQLEAHEEARGQIHYKAKLHTVMTSPYELAIHPRVLDIVEAMIGPDILLYDSTFIIKEPHTDAHVSWHQDLTFWGLSDDAQVTLWLALSRSRKDAQILEVLTLSPDRAHLHRHGPRGRVQEWESNRYWVEPTLHETGGPVPFYVTLRGAGREVEIGAFLSEDERKALYDDLNRAFRR